VRKDITQDDQSNPARLDRIERRLQALEDAEAIRNLKARYAALCDHQYDADGIASLFTEDAVWESPALGRFSPPRHVAFIRLSRGLKTLTQHIVNLESFY
jgi:SnoaL-like protein